MAYALSRSGARSAPGLLCTPDSESVRRPGRKLTTASVPQAFSRSLALTLTDTSALKLPCDTAPLELPVG